MILEWDKISEKVYETGDKNVALYPYDKSNESKPYPMGYAWNGITAITESPSGAEATDLWADDIKYATMRSAEQFGGTIEAYTYPSQWEQCDGSAEIATGVSVGQQSRRAFGLAYITTVGNDTDLNDYGEKLHLIYGATASPSERSYATINDSPEAITFSWEFTTTPVNVGVGYKPTSCITIDSTKVNKALYESFKAKVYGTANTDPYLPMPSEVISHFGANVQYTYTLVASKPDDWDTTYINYFTKSGNTYMPVLASATPPTWAANTYYARSIEEEH